MVSDNWFRGCLTRQLAVLWVCIDGTTMTLVDLHELLSERLDCRLWRSTVVVDDTNADLGLLVRVSAQRTLLSVGQHYSANNYATVWVSSPST